MKVKLLSSRCGHAPSRIKNGPVIAFAQAIGDVIEVENDEGQRMIDAGLATRETADSREKK